MKNAKYLLIFLCLGVNCSAQLLEPQARNAAHAQIVMLSEVRRGCAAGIVIGFDASHMYIATAAHVVADPARTPTIAVRLDGGLRRSGIFLSTFAPPGQGDLAVVSIARDSAVDRFLDSLDFALLSPDASVPRNSVVHSIGCSGGAPWNIGANERFSSVGNDYLVFNSDADEGQSGGGLFNGGWELIGMPIVAGSNGVQAQPISEILQRVRTWRVPVNLKERAAANRVADAETVAQESRAVNLSNEQWHSNPYLNVEPTAHLRELA